MSLRHQSVLAACGFLVCTFLVGAGLAGVWAAATRPTDVIAEGRDDYGRYCAACHGPQGAGDGEMAAKLVTPPADLTRIARASNGFPFWRVYQVIAGDTQVAGHNTFQMPQYAARLKADEGKPGYLPARIRILLLTHYLESLQSP